MYKWGFMINFVSSFAACEHNLLRMNAILGGRGRGRAGGRDAGFTTWEQKYTRMQIVHMNTA